MMRWGKGESETIYAGARVELSIVFQTAWLDSSAKVKNGVSWLVQVATKDGAAYLK